ncbi:MAG: nitroreductase family protein [Candidatus Bathyarchaeia archaeon]
MNRIELFEALSGCPTVRRFKRNSVDDAKVAAVLQAANYAPSGGNSQPWDFILIRETEAKRKIGAYATSGLETLRRVGALSPLDPDQRKALQRAAALARETDQVPFLILVCLDVRRALKETRLKRREILKSLSKLPQLRRIRDLTLYGSMFPAVQNLILAARGLGLGTCISLAPLVFEGEMKQLFGIPKSIRLVALLYMGYPHGRFITPKRLPVERFIHREKW